MSGFDDADGMDELVEWITSVRLRGLPDDTIEQARRVVFDGLGCALGAAASYSEIWQTLRRYSAERRVSGPCLVYGMEEKSDAATAALLNGTFGYYLDSEPHHPGAIMHPAAIVLPAVLAIAEKIGATGEQLVEAFVIGVEVACRVSNAFDPAALYDRGFHPSCVAGVFGSAAGCGKLLGLSGPELRSMFGLCGTQSSGLLAWVDDSSENARPFNMGLAARNGVYAAELAASGFHGAPQIFSSKYPLGRAFTGTWRAEEITGDLGKTFMIDELYFKLYACCAFIHPGLDGLLEILEREGLDASGIERIRLRFPTSGYHVIDGNPLRSHSAQYVLALAATRHMVEFFDVLNDRRDDPEIGRLFGQVTVIPDEELEHTYPEVYRSIVEVDTADGRTLTADVDYPLGSPERPVEVDALVTKFRRVTRDVLSSADQDALQRLLLQLDRQDSLEPLFQLLGGIASGR